jgi:pyruvate/2-oxoacid:ferredoxin oxidoreductase alpha subunit
MSKRMVVTGNMAAAYGARLCRPEVVAIYPITPQSEISEMMAEFVAKGQLNAKVFRVESEHSAMSILVGAAMAGARTYTASSSNGIFYMHEMLLFAAGARLPIVMATANRTASPPWNVWGDHMDSVTQRDTGWLQLYVESCQEILDSTIQAYKIAENNDVLLPIMICLDGFTLTHISEGIEIPDQESVDNFLPAFDSKYSLEKSLRDERPICLSHLSPPEASFMEYKYLQARAAERSKRLIKDVDQEFRENFGRGYGGLFESYRVDDAVAVLITMGSIFTTAKAVVDDFAEKGTKIGIIKLRSYRPFPAKELVERLRHVRAIGVVDRDFSCGYTGAVYADTAAALQEAEDRPKIVNFVMGLGGRDVTYSHFRHIIKRIVRVAATGKIEEKAEWVGVRF